MIELVVMSSLVANRDEVAKVSTAFHKKGADAAAKTIKELNPDYWPQPIRLVTEDGRPFEPGFAPVVLKITDGFLREEDWRPAWGFLSSLVHAANPYKHTPSQPRKDLVGLYRRMVDIQQRLTVLLARHVAWLTGPDAILMGLMQHVEDGRVHVQAGVRVKRT